MKILMFGWELPPIYAGGIGMVCYDLLRELSTQGHEVTYLMPFGPSNFSSDTGARVVIAENELPGIKTVSIRAVDTLFTAYQSPTEYEKTYTQVTRTGERKSSEKKALYGPNLYTEVDLFAKRAWEIAKDEDFDVVHAHDWMTFPAAIAAADRKRKPLVVHVHNTIYDRYLGNASQLEKDIELQGMQRANKVIAISKYVKDMIVSKYYIDPDKIEIVHNAPNTLLRNVSAKQTVNLGTEKVVLFTGRITAQKGPEYFVQCAKRVLEHEKDVKFVMAGSGDMFKRTIDLANNLGIGDKFLFTGFYTMPQAKALYERANCYVMPSVSEPFGIVPLEAMEAGAPTIISRTSGVSEVISHALKVDFWDIDRMANQVISVLRYPALAEALSTNGKTQVSRMNWSIPTSKCVSIYQSLL